MRRAASPPAAPRWLPACRVTILLHMIPAAAALWFLPQGFPVSHSRFWVNAVLPGLVVFAGAAALIAHVRGRNGLLQCVLAALAAGWTALAAAWVWIFPITGMRLALLAGGAAAVVWLVAGVAFRRQRCSWGAVAASLLAALIAVCIPIAQKAPQASTLPQGSSLDPIVRADDANTFQARVMETLDENLSVLPADGSAWCNLGSVRVDIQPLLTFTSRSPDGNWSISSPRSERRPPPRQLDEAWRSPTELFLKYRDIAEHELLALRDARTGAVKLDVQSQLQAPVDSHLNTFVDLTIAGHKRLSLAFSPCPDPRIEALPAGYPTGQPAQLAYLDGQGIFHVVRARSGEKGPFNELAQGPLPRGAPLSILLYDEQALVGRIVLRDWSAQCSTDLSPTAGWGLPQNAIEFIRMGPEPTAPVGIWVTLAGTSVGRGWDTVGHAPGVYRNRIELKPASPESN